MRNDPWLRRYWPQCPTEALDLVSNQVRAAALENPSPWATDAILRMAESWPWYSRQPRPIKNRFHCLVGHAVRVYRGYEVARTHSGNARKLKSAHGPHRTFTMQIPPVPGCVGLFWIIEEKGDAMLLSHAVPLEQAAPYGDMLIVETSHQEYWSRQARRGAHALRAERLPTAPTWSEYEEWPRGRVVYDCANRRFHIRADQQLHRPAFIRMIAERFEIDAKTAAVLGDDHYRSVRQLPLNNT